MTTAIGLAGKVYDVILFQAMGEDGRDRVRVDVWRREGPASLGTFFSEHVLSGDELGALLVGAEPAPAAPPAGGKPAPSDEENGAACERLWIIDWLDRLCDWSTPARAVSAETRAYRKVRDWLMDRQTGYEGRYH